VGKAVRPREDAGDHNGFPSLCNGNITIGRFPPEDDETTNENNERQRVRLESHEHPPDGGIVTAAGNVAT